MQLFITKTLPWLGLLALLVSHTAAVAVTPYGYPLEEILNYQAKHRYRYGLVDETTVVRRNSQLEERGLERLEGRDPSSRSHHGTETSNSRAKTTHCIPDAKKPVVKRDGEGFVWLWKRSAPVHTTAKCKGVQRLHPLP